MSEGSSLSTEIAALLPRHLRKHAAQFASIFKLISTEPNRQLVELLSAFCDRLKTLNDQTQSELTKLNESVTQSNSEKQTIEKSLESRSQSLVTPPSRDAIVQAIEKAETQGSTRALTNLTQNK